MARVSPPKGTRDLYPLEAARRRWLTERWRRVAIRHGFEEVDGPTFESCDLYAVKSGEGILGELFQAFSGKDPRDIEAIRGGSPAPFAMRPEFTPSLARMYAERARSLPKPFKCFQIGPFFRAERPQRGRLREFLQWNVDILGGAAAEGAERTEEKANLDAELIACVVGFLEECALSSEGVKIRISDRSFVADLVRACSSIGIDDAARLERALALLDKRDKGEPDRFRAQAHEIGLDIDRFDACVANAGAGPAPLRVLDEIRADVALGSWIEFDPTIVRGLAYYTGTVFEVIADGERAIAGGGRYDNLIELFGGPPTPAVGFAMGDVVISLLLQDKGLMPSDRELMEEIGARPDAFVISPNADLDSARAGLLARLRREGLHARRSYKATRNVGKLLSEAGQQHARCAIIVESSTEVSVKLLDAEGEQVRVPIEALGEFLRGHLSP